MVWDTDYLQFFHLESEISQFFILTKYNCNKNNSKSAILYYAILLTQSRGPGGSIPSYQASDSFQ